MAKLCPRSCWMTPNGSSKPRSFKAIRSVDLKAVTRRIEGYGSAFMTSGCPIYHWVTCKCQVSLHCYLLKVASSQKVFTLTEISKKKVPNHSPEDLLFSWIVLREVIRIWAKVKKFLRLNHLYSQQIFFHTSAISRVIFFQFVIYLLLLIATYLTKVETIYYDANGKRLLNP